MSSRSLSVLLGLCLLSACGGDDASSPQPLIQGDAGKASSTHDAGTKPVKADSGSSQTDPGNSDDGNSDDGNTGSNPGDGNTETPPSQGTDAGASDQPISTDKCDYTKDTALSKDLVVPAGKTVHVCAGATFTASGADTKIDVLGELIVDGTADAPVTFGGNGTPRSWHGIVVESGGKLTMKYGKIGGATYGLFTNAGATFDVDHTTFDTSFKAAVVQSPGSFSNCKFEATTPPNIAITNDVSIDDPNGTLTIIDASPSITNTNFDGSSGFTDMVRVGGNSSATFDHVYLHSAHCGFHTSGGTNTSIHVTNAILENLAYGIMAYATKPIIENSIFRNNANDVGECLGATTDNTPVLMNNSYAKGTPVIDATCFTINIVDPSPVDASKNASAGTSGL